MDQVSTKDWFLLALLSLIWGSSFILMKKALVAMDAMQMGSLRLGISFLAFLPIFWILRKKIIWPRTWKYGLMGLVGSGVPVYLFAFAQTRIDSSTAGLLNSLTPIFAFAVGLAFFGIKFDKIKFLGLFLGFIGAALLIMRNGFAVDEVNSYALLVILSTLLYGINANLVKHFFSKDNAILLGGFSFLFSGPASLLYLANDDSIRQITTHPQANMAIYSIILLAIIGTVMANVLYYKLVVSTSAVFASSVTYVIPIIAMFWGVMDGEKVGFYHLLSFFIIILGILLIKKK